MATRALKFVAHACKPSNFEKVNNDEVVDEIRGIAYDFKHGHGFKQRMDQSSTDSTDHNSKEDSTTVDRSTQPRTIGYFQEAVRAYIDEHQFWCADSELSYIYKTYFNTPHTRFNLINFAGDIIITKASLERNVNDHFAKTWFEGVLEIILECFSIE
jgi:hypothetical protein